MIAKAGFAARHTLIEEDSARVLPRLEAAGERFDVMFLDGWKTFDHVWVDTFYCARMLKVGGYIMFDDARMKAVRKANSLLDAIPSLSDWTITQSSVVPACAGGIA